MALPEILAPREEQVVYVRGFPESRYRTVAPYVREAFDSYKYWPHDKRICIADVGGFRNNDIVQKVFSDLPTISLNIPQEYHFPKRYGDITYDGFHMPLPSDSIPVVMAVDVLEQIPSWNRFRLVKEMIRVAQERVAISCPFYSAANVAAELTLLNRMKEAGLPEKASIKIHRQWELPKIEELVKMGKDIGYPFEIIPATNRRLDFHGLYTQVELLKMREGKFPGFDEITLAAQLAKFYDSSLSDIQMVQKPTWNEAYRAVLIIDKFPRGRILTHESDYIYSSNENTAYGRALALADHGNIENPLAVFKEVKQRGLNIAFEGPDGVGKTDTIAKVAEKLAEWGYIVATPMRHGPRQRLRELERRYGALLDKKAREGFLASTTNESIIAANAHTLLGPCNISLSDRTLASTEIYHKVHGLDRASKFVLENAHRIPPDLTIVLEVDDFEENWRRKEVKGDLANAEIDREDLKLQRQYYGEFTANKYAGPLWRVKSNGTVEETTEKVLNVLERFFGLPTRR